MSRVKEELLNRRTFKRAVSPEQRCEARQMSDQMSCTRCGLVWDMNDPDRPECRQRSNPAERPAKGGRVLVTGAERVHSSVLAGRSKNKPTEVGKAALAAMREKFGG